MLNNILRKNAIKWFNDLTKGNNMNPKSPEECLKELTKMLSATTIEDTDRLKTIGESLINLTKQENPIECKHDGEHDIKNGVNICLSCGQEI